ncbi:MAG: AAA family ATPase [Methanobacterium sp.]|mgnify:CR=1 FL=1|jgi:hypothetical protein|nr:AAA family ATPase [Methanobacterium sp.]HHY00322.1 AAA family ATPase [Methanothermobacter sp.]
MTPSKKGESALGKGLDALIRKEKPKSTEKIKKSYIMEKSSSEGSAKEKPSAKKVRKTQENHNKIIFEGVVLEVRKNPRISLWSAKSAAVLRFLKKTKPAFSISKEASMLIEEAVQQKYPEIWELFENEEF